MRNVNLRQLILALTCLSVLLTLAIAVRSSLEVQKELLVRGTLEDNRVYALKLAKSTDLFFETAQQRIKFAALESSKLLSDAPALETLVQRLLFDSQSFNAVLIADSQGKVLAVAPRQLALAGKQLDSEGNRATLDARAPLISAPFVAASGRLVVAISHPILDSSGQYSGYLSAVIYLQQASILKSLLGEHDYRDGSYLYVVDHNGRLVYHQDPMRVGEVVLGNTAVDAVTRGESGFLRLTNSRGVDVLAGYAAIPTASWGVVAQRPIEATLADLRQLTRQTLGYTVPWLLLSLVLIWMLSRTISAPLSKLAKNARAMDQPESRQKLLGVKAWYFEAHQIKASLIAGLMQVDERISRLNAESLTDQLTGLANRRKMERELQRWQNDGIAVAVIAIDIDHFKAINDAFGHDAGDGVLREFAQVMLKNCSPDDLVCRTGGEEFAMFLPYSSLIEARHRGERLCAIAASHAFSPKSLTISCGVAHFPETSGEIEEVLRRSDIALYEAKRRGRNRVVVAASSKHAV